MTKLSRADRRQMVDTFVSRQRTAGQLARKYGVITSLPKVLAYYRRHGRPSRAQVRA